MVGDAADFESAASRAQMIRDILEALKPVMSTSAMISHPQTPVEFDSS